MVETTQQKKEIIQSTTPVVTSCVPQNMVADIFLKIMNKTFDNKSSTRSEHKNFEKNHPKVNYSQNAPNQ